MTFHVTWTEGRIEEAKQYRRDGLSMVAIGKRMGSTKGSVQQLFFRLRREASRPQLATFETIPRRANDDTLHLSLLLAALREQRAA
jgi:hypothetical protein